MSEPPRFTQEELDHLLAEADEVRASLAASDESVVDIGAIWPLCELVFEIVGYGTIAADNPLGISPTILNKLMKFGKPMEVRTAHMIADRVRTYLRSIGEVIPTKVEIMDDLYQPPPATVRFGASRWVAVDPKKEIKEKISLISDLLDSIIQQVTHANVSPEEAFLSQIDRQQLIAILETTLQVLKAPLVERGLLEQTGEALAKGARSAIEKGVQVGLGKLMMAAAKEVIDLLHRIF